MSLVGLQHIDTGSNTWVVDGALTRSRRPLLANDAHMGFVAPNQNFLVHLTAPGLDVRGVTLPGMPGVLLGHNERIAWGSTALMADAQDVFVEELDATGEHYRFQGEWRRRRARGTRRSTSATAQPVRVRVRLTHHGPLVRARGALGARAALGAARYAAGRPDVSRVERRARLGTSSAPRFAATACRRRTSPTPTSRAHIGAQSAGCVPRRAAGDGMLPAPGARRPLRVARLRALRGAALRVPSGRALRRARQPEPRRRPLRPSAVPRRWHPPYRARRIRTLLRGTARSRRRDASRESSTIACPRTTSFVARRVRRGHRRPRAAPIPCGGPRGGCSPTGMGRLSPDSAAAAIAKECAALVKTAILHAGRSASR